MSVHYRDPEAMKIMDTIIAKKYTNGYPFSLWFNKIFWRRICDYFCRWFGMNILALKITGPRKANDWENQVKGSITDNGEYSCR